MTEERIASTKRCNSGVAEGRPKLQKAAWRMREGGQEGWARTRSKIWLWREETSSGGGGGEGVQEVELKEAVGRSELPLTDGPTVHRRGSNKSNKPDTFSYVFVRYSVGLKAADETYSTRWCYCNTCQTF